MRTVVELSVVTGISPAVLAGLDADTLATMIDVVIEQRN